LLLDSDNVIRVFHWGGPHCNSRLTPPVETTLCLLHDSAKLPEVHTRTIHMSRRIRLTGRCPVTEKLMSQHRN
jgi:hypothetical protein